MRKSCRKEQPRTIGLTITKEFDAIRFKRGLQSTQITQANRGLPRVGLKSLKGAHANPCRFRDILLLKTETDPSQK